MPVDTDVFIARRFDRLRRIIQLRNDEIKRLDKQVLELFEVGNISGIETLMHQKELMLSTNQQLTQFILKWEDQTTMWLEDQFFTSSI